MIKLAKQLNMMTVTVLVSFHPLTENSGISDKEICKVKENSPYLHHFEKYHGI